MNEKVLLVTGVSSDIGMAYLKKYSDEYDLIIGQYVHENDTLQSLKEKLKDKLCLVQADLSSDEGINTLINKISETDLVITGFVHLVSPKPASLQFRKECWNNLDYHLTVSVKSAHRLLQHILPYMVKEKSGNVVIMLTAYVNVIPPKFLSTYVTAKYALLGLMKSLAAEYEPYGVCINAISPDMIDTKFIDSLPHTVIETVQSKALNGRLLTTDDVIPEIHRLMSNQPEPVYGQNVIISN